MPDRSAHPANSGIVVKSRCCPRCGGAGTITTRHFGAPGMTTEQRIGRGSEVSNAPFRERFIFLRDAGEITSGDVARELGWTLPPKKRGRLDTTRVRRVLGLTMTSDGAPQRTVSVKTATALAAALGMDPVEVGI